MPTAASLPEFGVLRVHHGWTLGQDLGDPHRADLLFDISRNLLDLWNEYFFQHHTEHPVKGRAAVRTRVEDKSEAAETETWRVLVLTLAGCRQRSPGVLWLRT